MTDFVAILRDKFYHDISTMRVNEIKEMARIRRTILPKGNKNHLLQALARSMVKERENWEKNPRGVTLYRDMWKVILLEALGCNDNRRWETKDRDGSSLAYYLKFKSLRRVCREWRDIVNESFRMSPEILYSLLGCGKWGEAWGVHKYVHEMVPHQCLFHILKIPPVHKEDEYLMQLISFFLKENKGNLKVQFERKRRIYSVHILYAVISRRWREVALKILDDYEETIPPQVKIDSLILMSLKNGDVELATRLVKSEGFKWDDEIAANCIHFGNIGMFCMLIEECNIPDLISQDTYDKLMDASIYSSPFLGYLMEYFPRFKISDSFFSHTNCIAISNLPGKGLDKLMNDERFRKYIPQKSRNNKEEEVKSKKQKQ